MKPAGPTMSITYNPQGKLTLEPTKGNILGITEIVLQHFEKTLLGLEALHPDKSAKELRLLARDTLEENIETVSRVVKEACRNAMMSRPEDVLRRDLIGRILFHRIEKMIIEENKKPRVDPHRYISAVLKTVRTIIGETHYENLNEYSVRPSLEYCLVHELGQSQINWKDFYNQNLVNLLMVRIKNLIKRWLEQNANHKSEFIASVNTHLSEPDLEFRLEEYNTLMKAWGVIQN